LWHLHFNSTQNLLPGRRGGQKGVETNEREPTGKDVAEGATALEAKVKAAIEEKRMSERHEIRAKMEEMARESGFSVAELFGRGKRAKVAIKYRNPKDPSQTWTGRGRRPMWLVEAGGDVRRFLIS
jgi:DNA-binding protein H-NS